MPAYCSTCGATIDAGGAFCGECGAPVSASVPQPVTLRRQDAQMIAHERSIEEGKNLLLGLAIVGVVVLAFFLWGVLVGW